MAKLRNDLPHNAVRINGVFLEDVISGFTTLRTSNREYIPRELTTYNNTKNDGSKLNYSRYEPRIITIEFVLGTNDYTDYAPMFEDLMKYLDVEDAEILFNDEPDKYYIGTLSVSEVSKQNTFATGKYLITCYDPFKYAVNETVVNSSVVTVDDSPITALTTNNNGGYKTFPKFEVQFANDTSSAGVIGNNGECGYVLLSKDNYSIQFGDDEEKNTTVANVSTDFRKISIGSTWKQTTALPLPNWSYLKATPQGTSKISTTSGLQPNSYSTAVSKKVYGPMVYTQLPYATPNEFELSWKQVFALSSTSTTAKKQMGMYLINFYDTSDNLLFAFGYKKLNSTALTGEVVYFDSDGLHTLQNKVSFAYTGKLGYKKSGSSYVARLSTSKIRRYKGDDDLWHIHIDTPFGAYEVGNYETAPSVNKIGIFQGKYSSNATPYNNALTTAQFISGDIDLINTFRPSDLLEIDCSDASVYRNNAEEETLGDISNDWSNFYLDRGNNTIYVQWSDWVETGYEPTITMKYRKRWL